MKIQANHFEILTYNLLHSLKSAVLCCNKEVATGQFNYIRIHIPKDYSSVEVVAIDGHYLYQEVIDVQAYLPIECTFEDITFYISRAHAKIIIKHIKTIKKYKRLNKIQLYIFDNVIQIGEGEIQICLPTEKVMDFPDINKFLSQLNEQANAELVPQGFCFSSRMLKKIAKIFKRAYSFKLLLSKDSTKTQHCGIKHNKSTLVFMPNIGCRDEEEK